MQRGKGGSSGDKRGPGLSWSPTEGSPSSDLVLRLFPPPPAHRGSLVHFHSHFPSIFSVQSSGAHPAPMARGSYLVPRPFLLLWRRLGGGLRPFSAALGGQAITHLPTSLMACPFSGLSHHAGHESPVSSALLSTLPSDFLLTLSLQLDRKAHPTSRTQTQTPASGTVACKPQEAGD